MPFAGVFPTYMFPGANLTMTLFRAGNGIGIFPVYQPTLWIMRFVIYMPIAVGKLLCDESQSINSLPSVIWQVSASKHSRSDFAYDFPFAKIAMYYVLCVRRTGAVPLTSEYSLGLSVTAGGLLRFLYRNYIRTASTGTTEQKGD